MHDNETIKERLVRVETKLETLHADLLDLKAAVHDISSSQKNFQDEMQKIANSNQALRNDFNTIFTNFSALKTKFIESEKMIEEHDYFIRTFRATQRFLGFSTISGILGTIAILIVLYDRFF